MEKIKIIIKKIISRENRLIFAGAIIFGLVLGLIFSSGGKDTSSSSNLKELVSDGHDHSETKIWTCSMHPQIRKSGPGPCPLCGMDLIPASSGVEEEGLTHKQLKLSKNAIKLAEIQIKAVERRYVDKEIPMVGKIEYDETKLGFISSRIPGRIDKLYVDYTGISVKKGDPLVSLYSPELITAQQELIQASKTLRRYRNDKNSSLRKMSAQMLSVVKEKLRLWGLTKKQIIKIEKSGKVEDHLIIYSPIKGIIIHKNAVEGMYVKTGSKIYTIADLSMLWVKLDVYESDLSWIRLGQSVEFETEAYPGEIFKGKIEFIDPVLDPKTRTVKLRVNVINSSLKLKPEMFVRGKVRSRLTKSGEVLDPGMNGVYEPMDANEAPLIIPVSAALITGKRSIVYVSIPEKKGVFEGKEIILGAKAGNNYIVKQGLELGEKVVVNGAFKIDSDLQIQAKPSMMNPDGGISMSGHNHGNTDNKELKVKAKDQKVTSETQVKKNEIPHSFMLKIDRLAEPYFLIGKDLSSDTLKNINNSVKDLLARLKKIDMKLLKGKNHMVWMGIEDQIVTNGNKLMDSKNIERSREIFEKLSDSITKALKDFGSGKSGVYLFHCPMAFDNKGAYWLQDNMDTKNPYFGKSMLTCKDLLEPLHKQKEDRK